MKSVDQHLADILSKIEPIAPLDLQLLDAHGCKPKHEAAQTWSHA